MTEPEIVLSDLEAKAKAATPGRWYAQEDWDYVEASQPETVQRLCACIRSLHDCCCRSLPPSARPCGDCRTLARHGIRLDAEVE